MFRTPSLSLLLALFAAFCVNAQEEGKQPDNKPEKKEDAKVDTESKDGKTEPNKTEGMTDLPVLNPKWVSSFNWRSVGPASMGGRIVDLAVVESDPTIFYVATASGGLFKTTNNGTTFSPVFEKESTVSIGDVCVASSNPNILWVGTGEHNARNSVSWGDGIYKSIDGGKTWKHMGLKESFQIGRIAIHSKDPNTVYVGALGRLWGPNEERGLYKTTDGGKTWEKSLFIDEKTGCMDVAMHPSQPDTLIVAMYERQRGAFDVGDPIKRWGPGSGLYKTTDGGKNWKKLTKGLPTGELGRIGINYYRKNPDNVYAIVESDKIGKGPAAAFMGITGGQRVRGAVIQGVTDNGPAKKTGLQADDRILEIDGKKLNSYNDLVVKIREHDPGDTVKLKIRRDGKELEMKLTFGKRKDDSNRPYTSYLGGQRANASKQQERSGFKGYETGGVFKSTDGGETWKRINSLNPRPFYYSQIQVDPNDETNIFVMGVNLHQTVDGGKEFKNSGSRVHPDHHVIWIDSRDGRHLILGCDGGLYVSHDRGKTWDFVNIMAIGQFYDVGVDTRNPYWVYGGLQDNGSWGAPNRKRGSTGPLNSDWLRVGGGDGFVCRSDPNDPTTIYVEMQYGRIWRVNLETGARVTITPRPPQGKRYRWNWKTPFTLSPHNSKIIYCAGNYVFRSLDRGNKMQKISPEITRTDKGSATAIASSPRDAGVLYVGTDDGALWVTRDGGGEWTNVTKNVGLADHFQVNSIEASQFADGRAYVAFDGHRNDSDEPHLYVTEDFGMTWTCLNANLPTGTTRTLREDAKNENLLYVGTEFAVWASLDRGATWTKINNNLPTVAIHEIAVHPIQNEIVAATHGRSVWILDVTPLRQMTKEVVAKKKGHLFQSPTGVLWAGALGLSRRGHRNFSGQNPSFGSSIHYYLAEDAADMSLEIMDIKGNLVRAFRIEKDRKKRGLHRLQWDLRGVAQRSSSQPPALANREQAFKQLDTNKDGKLTKEDIQEGPRAQFLRTILQRADKNKDGKVTPQEFKEMPAFGTRSGRGGNRVGPPVHPGTYLAKLKIDGEEFVQEVRVKSDPEFPAAMLLEELEESVQKQRPEFAE